MRHSPVQSTRRNSEYLEIVSADFSRTNILFKCAGPIREASIVCFCIGTLHHVFPSAIIVRRSPGFEDDILTKRVAAIAVGLVKVLRADDVNATRSMWFRLRLKQEHGLPVTLLGVLQSLQIGRHK